MLYIFSPEEELLALLSPDFTHSSSSGGTIKQTFLSEAFPAEFDSEVFDGCLYWGAIHKEVLNGENIFQFTIPSKQIQTAYVQEGNLVAFRDLDSYWQFFEIKRLVDLHEDGLTRTAFCEHIFYELIDDIVTDKRPSGSAIAALSGMLENTRWQVGIVDDLGSASTSAYYISALEAVQKVANAWGGELRWRCVVEGGVITRYVDLVAMRGVDTGKQFVYSKDILSVEREVDISTVATALYGRGKGVELESGGYGRRLTFANVVAADKPAGQEWIGDDDALARWGRPGGRHRFDVFTDEEETVPEVLLEKTRAELARRKDPRVTYRLDVVSLEQLTGYEHEQVRLGDLVRVIDREFKPELVVSARVIDIERDLLAPENTKVVLGSFAPTIVEATINIGRRVEDMANKPYNTKWLDGIIDVLQNAIENRQAYIWETPQGTLHMNAPTYEQATEAMLLGGGRFAIANQKDGQGGWNWRTFGTGAGFTGDEINAGLVRAEFIQVGSATTFEAGYDPTKGSMGVDADCVGLWHFDGSLNSHKGVSAIGDENFDTGCFGQAIMVDEFTTNLLTANQASIETDTTGFAAAGDATISRDTTEHWDGSASLKVVTTATADTGVSTAKQATTAGKTYTASVYLKGSGTVTVALRAWDDTPTLIGQQKSSSINLTSSWQRVTVTYTIPSGATKTDIAILTDTANATTFYADGLQLEEKAHATTFVIGTRLGVLKIPTTGMSASEGTTISFRVGELPDADLTLLDLRRPDNVARLRIDIIGDRFIVDHRFGSFFGPYRSVLKGWDSISLAWKSDRLSLVVNDIEYYIENPGLLDSFSDYFFVGTNKDGDRAINTLVDELRIDKVYRDADTRIAWHKASVPFYTSEDMKQWPGYIRAETDGLKVYDSENALRVLVGSWLKDAIRKYGIKIIDGEIHSSTIYGTNFRSGAEGATTYISLTNTGNFRVVKDGETILETLTDVTEGGSWYFYKLNGDMFGRILYYNDLYPGFSIEGTNAAGNSGALNVKGAPVRIEPIDGNILPYNIDADLGSGNIGQSNRKWFQVRSYLVTSGDLAFEENSCPICGMPFKDGDVLCLLVKTIDEAHGTLTIPVHDKCKNTPATLQFKVPEITTEYNLNEKGEIELIPVAAFEEVEEDIFTLHPDYEFKKETGTFQRKANEENTELFGAENLIKGIQASKKSSLVTDVVKKKKPKMKTIQIQVGGPLE